MHWYYVWVKLYIRSWSYTYPLSFRQCFENVLPASYILLSTYQTSSKLQTSKSIFLLTFSLSYFLCSSRLSVCCCAILTDYRMNGSYSSKVAAKKTKKSGMKTCPTIEREREFVFNTHRIRVRDFNLKPWEGRDRVCIKHTKESVPSIRNHTKAWYN